jgi:oligopeptide/dipeptide ABC transporter ATP-binding protein
VTVPPPLLAVHELAKTFRARGAGITRTPLRAVDTVSFELQQGETLGLVGESGSGKTTIGRLLVRLEQATHGRVEFDGMDISSMSRRESLVYCRNVQMIFQNTQSALNGRRTIRSILSDPLKIHHLGDRPARDDAMAEMLSQVGLSAELLNRYPQQLSSGQRQRLGIARALLVKPRLVVADEPVSALDVSVQAQVLNLFAVLRRDLRLTMLFISHDLRAVSFLCDRIAVLYLGQLVELGSREAVLERPAHPYTRALVSSIPTFRPGGGFHREVMRGELGQLSADARGCPFVQRCPLWLKLGKPAVCVDQRPELRSVETGTSAACHFAADNAADSRLTHGLARPLTGQAAGESKT